MLPVPHGYAPCRHGRECALHHLQRRRTCVDSRTSHSLVRRGNLYQETKNDLQENQKDQADIMDDLLQKLTIITVVGLAVSMAALRGAFSYKHRLVILQAIYAVINCTLTIYFNKDASQKVDT